MTIPPYFGDNPSQSMWDDLGAGAPTIMALAKVCGERLGRPPSQNLELSLEAICLLHLARERGAFELKATDKAFDAVDRFLIVHVEISDDETLAMKIRGDAEATSRMFAGFCELCACGLVMHHIYGDFSLTKQGFEESQQVDHPRLSELLDRFSSKATDVL